MVSKDNIGRLTVTKRYIHHYKWIAQFGLDEKSVQLKEDGCATVDLVGAMAMLW
jgi:hypothetical protein